MVMQKGQPTATTPPAAPRVAAVVPIPRSERATLAVIEGRSILEVDAALRNAYIDLAQTCVQAIAWARTNHAR